MSNFSSQASCFCPVRFRISIISDEPANMRFEFLDDVLVVWSRRGLLQFFVIQWLIQPTDLKKKGAHYRNESSLLWYRTRFHTNEMITLSIGHTTTIDLTSKLQFLDDFDTLMATIYDSNDLIKPLKYCSHDLQHKILSCDNIPNSNRYMLSK